MDTLSLPQELIDTIVDDLAGYDDTKAWAKCLLVAWCFVPRCRKHLFAKILIDGSVSMDKLERVLRHEPGLSAYIKQVHFCQDGWMQINGDLPVFLATLTSVQLISFDTAYRGIVSWIDLPTDTREEFLRVFRLPSLTDLTICNIVDLPLSFVDYLGNLDHLRLIDDVDFCDDLPTSSFTSSPGPWSIGRLRKCWRLLWSSLGMYLDIRRVAPAFAT